MAWLGIILRGFVFIGALAGVSLLTGCTGLQFVNATVVMNSAVWPNHYTRSLNHAFGNDPRQKLDVYCPEKITPHPKAVIFLYGGTWRCGSKHDYRFVGEALTSRGFIAVVPDYRLYPQVKFPAFVADGAAAVRWVHDHIAEFGGDPAQIYLMGHSAGSHTAALLTVDAHYLQAVGLDRHAIRATAGMSGVYDFAANPWDAEVFGSLTNAATLQPQPSPMTFVDGQEPPMLLLHGMKDWIVSPQNTVRLTECIRNAGGQVEQITYAHRGHVGMLVALSSPNRWLDPVLDDVAKFFRRH